MSLRGVLRGFGLKVGPTTPRSFAARIRELVAGHPALTAVAEALLAARRCWGRSCEALRDACATGRGRTTGHGC